MWMRSNFIAAISGLHQDGSKLFIRQAALDQVGFGWFGWMLLVVSVASPVFPVLQGSRNGSVSGALFLFCVAFGLVFFRRTIELDPVARRATCWWSLEPFARRRFLRWQMDLDAFDCVRLIYLRGSSSISATRREKSPSMWAVLLDHRARRTRRDARGAPTLYLSRRRAAALAVASEISAAIGKPVDHEGGPAR